MFPEPEFGIDQGAILSLKVWDLKDVEKFDRFSVPEKLSFEIGAAKEDLPVVVVGQQAGVLLFGRCHHQEKENPAPLECESGGDQRSRAAMTSETDSLNLEK